MVRRFFNFCDSVFKNINMKTKLLLAYLVLIVIPLGILAFFIYSRSSFVLTEKMIDLSSQSLEQLNASLGYSFQNVIRSSNIVFSNRNIQDILLQESGEYDTGKQIDDYNFLSDYMTGIQNDQSIYRIRLYLKGDTIFTNENINFFSLKSIQNTDFYKLAADKNGQIYITEPYYFKYGGLDDYQEIISAIRIINNPNMYGESIGFVSTDILLNDIREVIKKSTLVKNGFVFLINDKNKIITASDQSAYAQYKEIINTSIKENTEMVWKKENHSGEDVYTASIPVQYTDWKLFTIIPASNILVFNALLGNYTALLTVIIGVIAYFLALLISYSIVNRLRRLMKVMRVAEAGDLSIKAEISGKDEIGELEEKFNKMLMKIKSLADEKFSIGKESKNAELRALQAQINPHFLYNTLELVTCMAFKYKAGDIIKLVNLLAKFYKLSLSNGKDIISIADEIAHIETYVNIQNQRFDGNVKLELDIDERILSCSILKLVLQPIVENSILHGIMEKENQTGTVNINGYFICDDIMLTVQDDGIGMDDEKLLSLFTAGQGESGHGFGIKNVNQRLKINYGENYGLNVNSSRFVGTTVKLTLPAIKYQS